MRRIEIEATLADRIRDHLFLAAPEEGCGLLSGGVSEAGAVLRVVGVHPSPNVADGDRRTAYRIDPRVQLDVQRRLRGSGFGVVGAFHSHPAGPSEPSRRDAAEALPNFVYVIGSPASAGACARLRAFVLRADGSGFDEAPLDVTIEAFAVAGADRTLDLRGEVCPYTFIRAMLALEDAADATTLAVRLDHPPAFESVPRSLADGGHDVLRVERREGEAIVLVRKAGARPGSRAATER